MHSAAGLAVEVEGTFVAGEDGAVDAVGNGVFRPEGFVDEGDGGEDVACVLGGVVADFIESDGRIFDNDAEGIGDVAAADPGVD